METHASIPPKTERSTTFITDSEIDAFLSAAIERAEKAAEEFARACQCAPIPFDSVEEWHAFDAVLERRLASTASHRVEDAA